MNNNLNVKSLLTGIGVILLVLTGGVGCSEEFTGQLPVNKGTPAQVTVLPGGVENFPGGATITYQLPDETDLLYVKAVFQRPDGSVVEEKASIFSNSLTLLGFARSVVVPVQLITVDRSRNESEPVHVEIKPEDSPIYDILESIHYREGFGGFVVGWDNPYQANVAIEVMKRDEERVYRKIETFYSSEKEPLRSVRGQQAVPSEYAILVRDMYKNYADTFKFELTPWYEEYLDKSLFEALPYSHPPFSATHGRLTWLWDENYFFAEGSSVTYFYLQAQNVSPPFFQISLGQEAFLSRFRMWSRTAYIYRLHSPKDIVIFGTNDPVVANNPNSPDSEWIKLLEGTSFRPSGGGPDDPITEEDRAYADAGEEFEFPIENPSVRYVRFKSLISWTNTWGLHLCELSFWGIPADKKNP